LGIRQKNQHFGTVDLVVTILLMGTVSSIAGALLAESLQDDRPARARASAQAMALQLQGQQDLALKSAQAETRSPASENSAPILTEGRMGRDPWGRPYHYSVRQSTHGPRRLIYVWSEGPNGKSESEAAIEAEETPFHFKGDDNGYVQKSDPSS
jgi:hypothetical protein